VDGQLRECKGRRIHRYIILTIENISKLDFYPKQCQCCLWRYSRRNKRWHALWFHRYTELATYIVLRSMKICSVTYRFPHTYSSLHWNRFWNIYFLSIQLITKPTGTFLEQFMIPVCSLANLKTSMPWFDSFLWGMYFPRQSKVYL